MLRLTLYLYVNVPCLKKKAPKFLKKKYLFGSSIQFKAAKLCVFYNSLSPSKILVRYFKLFINQTTLINAGDSSFFALYLRFY